MNIDELRASAGVDRLRIDDEVADQSAKFLYIAELYAQAEALVEAHKDVLGRVEAAVAIRVRQRLEAEGVKITEKLIDQHMKLDPEYQQAQQNVVNAKAQLGRMKALRDTYYARKDLLVALSYNQRAEQRSLQTAYPAAPV